MAKSTEYMNVDLTGYKPYLQSMARKKGVSVTKYIRDLIGADYEAHREEFLQIREEELRELEEARKD